MSRHQDLPDQLGMQAFSPASLYKDFLDHVTRKSESYKFIRMADDLHDVAGYLSEMRICFIMVTVTLYVLLGIFFLRWCVQRNANRQRQLYAGSSRRLNNRADYQTTDEYQNATNTTTTGQTNTDDLVSVRSDGHVGTGLPNKTTAGMTPSYMGRNHRSQAPPSFMRHGMQHINHQTSANNHDTRATARLIGNATNSTGNEGGHVQQQQPGSAFHHHHTHHPVPHLETQPPEDTIIGTITSELPIKHIVNNSAVSLRHHSKGPDSSISATDM